MRTRVVRLIAVVGVVAALAIGLWRRMRPVPFDAAAWRAGDAKLRFRMKDALLAERARGRGELATRHAFDATLGPDDEHGDDPRYRSFRLRTWGGNPWYLRVSFDRDGRVERFIIAPD